MIVRTQTMHYQPDWLLEIGLHVYCSLLFLDSNSILAGGYSDCFLIKHLKWVDLNWKERNRSMTYQKLEWNRWSWNKNHFKKIHQKSCQNLMTTLLNPHLFFSQPGNIKKKSFGIFFVKIPSAWEDIHSGGGASCVTQPKDATFAKPLLKAMSWKTRWIFQEVRINGSMIMEVWKISFLSFHGWFVGSKCYSFRV